LAVVVEFKDWEKGGSDIQTIGGVDFAELSLRLADFLMRNQSYGNQQAVPYRVDEPGDIKVCFQPGCIQRPENVFAIKQEWTWHPNQGHKMDRGEHARPVVRAFCEGHSDRGDCDLEDNDDNYELIAYFPPIGGDEPVELTPDERETLDRTLDRMEGIGGDDERPASSPPSF
jgi:hypothetical protein